ncbi:MAG TPA: sensor domain-containing diguanylate cyclase [Candidatus Brocadiaceae bacterium]|nr:sensor domain-containing diguanylate cyclase [Candidatus Brocadiaceae bacterium]
MKFYDENTHLLPISEGLTVESLKEHFWKISALYHFNKDLNLVVSLEGLFDKTKNFLMQSLRLDGFCFLLADENSRELKVWKASDNLYNAIQGVVFLPGEDISNIVQETGEAILVRDAGAEARFLGYKERVAKTGSLVSIPLKLCDNRVIGVLNVHKVELNYFEEKDKTFFCDFSQTAANVMERIRLCEKTHHETIFDDLTALHTAKYFLKNSQRESSNAKRYNRTFSILVANVDKFKRINDERGQPLGDEILKKFAFVLRANLRDIDIVCRYGGDEFAILLPGIDKTGAILTAEKMRVAVEKALTIEIIGVKPEQITATFAATTYPQDGKTAKELLVRAAEFLLVGKRQGGNIVVHKPPQNKVDTMETKSLTRGLMSPVLSVEELYDLLRKDVNRTNHRYRVALKVTNSINCLQSIEIGLNATEWKTCTVRDISKTGFRGELDVAIKVNSVYKCKVVIEPDVRISDVFSIRIAHTTEIHSNRHLFGAEVIDGDDYWKKLFALLTG